MYHLMINAVDPRNLSGQAVLDRNLCSVLNYLLLRQQTLMLRDITWFFQE